MINRRRIVRSPRFETAPSFCLPPVDFCSGVSPSQAAKSRPAGNPSAAGTSAVIAVEAIGPTPGIVINRRAVGSDFERWLISASKTVICASNAVKVSTSSFRITRTLSGSEDCISSIRATRRFNMGYALRKDVAVFHQVPAKSVDALGALTHQKISGPEDDCIRLLLLGLDRNEAHARSLHSFTDGLGIRRIVLLPLDEWLDVGWRHQSSGMTQFADLSCPVVRTGTGFHRDDAGRLCREKADELPASNALAEHNLAGDIGPMHLEHVLRDVQPDRSLCRHGGLLQCDGSTPSPWHADAVGGRRLHHPSQPFGLA